MGLKGKHFVVSAYKLKLYRISQSIDSVMRVEYNIVKLAWLHVSVRDVASTPMGSGYLDHFFDDHSKVINH